MSNKLTELSASDFVKPFLFYRQEEGGPLINIPVTKNVWTHAIGNRVRALHLFTHLYPFAHSFVVLSRDDEIVWSIPGPAYDVDGVDL